MAGDRSESVFTSVEGEAAIKAVYEETLAAWPVPLERSRLATSLGETFSLSWGNPARPPLVLLHGTLANSSMWIGEAERLSRARHVHAVDLPGEPGHSSPVRGSWQDDTYAGWLAEVLDALGIASAPVVGMSLGAWVGLLAGARRPERVDALVAMCPSGIGPARRSLLVRAVWASLRGPTGMEGLTRSLYGGVAVPERAVEVGMLLARHARPRLETPLRLTDDDLRRIRGPIMLIVGGRDVMLDSRASADRLARVRPDARICYEPHAGHALIGFGEEIAAFVG